MSTPPRSFPDFLILGAPKAGTTALCEFLQGHPGVRIARSKEHRYFDRHFKRGPRWYRQTFFSDADRELCGDGTPTYLANPTALMRVADEAPRARLFVLLREPGARAVSSWWMQLCQGQEHLGFQSALRECLSSPVDTQEEPVRGYLHYGLYGPQLKTLYELFSVQQVHVIWSAELRRNPGAEVDKALSFLGLDPTLRKGDLRPRWQAMGVRTARLYRVLANRSPGVLRSRGFHRFSTLMRMLGDRPVKPGEHLRRFLSQYFEDSDLMLEEVLGERPPWRR